MIHPDTELRFISPEIGFGVVATKKIPKGTITWVQDDLDQVFTPRQVQRMGPRMQQLIDIYCFRNRKGQFVLCWDHARFVNHSFNSNCLSTCYDFEFAVRDILPGEQLTDDYGYLNVSQPFQPLDEGTERKLVYRDDVLRMAPVWDQQLQETFPLMTSVEQPLADLLSPRTRNTALAIAQGRCRADSIASLYHEEPSLAAKTG